jgi:hypothetical protein
MEELMQNLENYKHKSKEVMGEKDLAMISEQGNTQRIMTDYEDRIIKKDYEIEEFLKKNSLL